MEWPERREDCVARLSLLGVPARLLSSAPLQSSSQDVDLVKIRTRMEHESPTPVVVTPRVLPIAVAAVAIAIFVFDSVTPVETTAGVLYGAVVLMAVRFFRPRGVVIAAVGCTALTVLSHFLSPGDPWASTPLINRFLGVSAIGATTFLALKNRSAQMALQLAELERVTRLRAMGELTASIAHEIIQPLSAVVTNCNTCLH